MGFRVGVSGWGQYGKDWKGVEGGSVLFITVNKDIRSISLSLELFTKSIDINAQKQTLPSGP